MCFCQKSTCSQLTTSGSVRRTARATWACSLLTDTKTHKNIHRIPPHLSTSTVRWAGCTQHFSYDYMFHEVHNREESSSISRLKICTQSKSSLEINGSNKREWRGGKEKAQQEAILHNVRRANGISIYTWKLQHHQNQLMSIYTRVPPKNEYCSKNAFLLSSTWSRRNKNSRNQYCTDLRFSKHRDTDFSLERGNHV